MMKGKSKNIVHLIPSSAQVLRVETYATLEDKAKREFNRRDPGNKPTIIETHIKQSHLLHLIVHTSIFGAIAVLLSRLVVVGTKLMELLSHVGRRSAGNS